MVTFNSVITLLVFLKIYFKCALDECNLNAKKQQGKWLILKNKIKINYNIGWFKNTAKYMSSHNIQGLTTYLSIIHHAKIRV